MAKKDEEKVLESGEVEETSVEVPKKVRRKSVTVKLKIKQIVNGKRGFTDETGKLKWLSGLKFSFEPQTVDQEIWDAAESEP